MSADEAKKARAEYQSRYVYFILNGYSKPRARELASISQNGEVQSN